MSISSDNLGINNNHLYLSGNVGTLISKVILGKYKVLASGIPMLISKSSTSTKLNWMPVLNYTCIAETKFYKIKFKVKEVTSIGPLLAFLCVLFYPPINTIHIVFSVFLTSPVILPYLLPRKVILGL